MNVPSKCWRERVVAEITPAHLAEFAHEAGIPMSDGEAIAFLNRNGQAYEVWKHMMYAAEDYLKACLGSKAPQPHMN